MVAMTAARPLQVSVVKEKQHANQMTIPEMRLTTLTQSRLRAEAAGLKKDPARSWG
jgi:hypothetical protein